MLKPKRTIKDLCDISWNWVTDHPKTKCPHRASVAAIGRYQNAAGANFIVTVYENRKRTRYWLEVLCGGCLHVYLTTTSKAKAKEWIDAIDNGRR